MLNFIRKKIRFHNWFRKSHRSIGLFLVVFLLLIAVTGILLNHSEDLKLSKHYVPGYLASAYYPENEILAFSYLGHDYFSLAGSLYFDQEVLTWCDQMQGLAIRAEQTLILCDGELLVFSDTQQLIERMGIALGLPESLDQLTVIDDRILLGAKAIVYQFDIDTLGTKVLEDRGIDWPKPRPLSNEKILAESVTWQQFILDVHSAMFIGPIGKWFADLLGLGIITMALSGLAMRLKRSSQSRRNSSSD